MGFVGNYAPYGLSPQVHDMPVILKKPLPPEAAKGIISTESGTRTHTPSSGKGF